MFQTDQATAAATLPTPAAAATPGFFTNGNPSTGVAATILDADFMNMLMMELSNVVTGAGIALSKTTYNQVLLAIKRLTQNTAVLADTGAVNAYSAANATPLVAGTWVDGVVQAVKIAHTNTGASTYSPDTLTAVPIYGLGLQPLQGGELLLNGTAILMKTTIAGVDSGNPICVLMECAGGAQQVAPATQSQHAMQLGQAVGRLLNVQVFTSSGTYTPTTGTNAIIVEVIGGGGGGGGANAAGAGQVSIGGNGGGAAYAKGRFTSGFSGAAITIGAPGAGGGTGGTGGTTSLGSLISASGGGGGGPGTAFNPPGSSGGASSGGSTITGGNITSSFGYAAQAGVAVSTSTIFNVLGAQSQFGPGPIGTFGNGAAATMYGAGGAGALCGPSTGPFNGGVGKGGIMTIWEYA